MNRIVATLFILGLFLVTTIFSCKKGCLDNTALNYDSNKTYDDGSCLYYADRINGKYKGIKIIRLDNEIDTSELNFKVYKRGVLYNTVFFDDFLQRYEFPNSFIVASDTFGKTDSVQYYPLFYIAKFSYHNDTLNYFISERLIDDEQTVIFEGYGVKQY